MLDVDIGLGIAKTYTNAKTFLVGADNSVLKRGILIPIHSTKMIKNPNPNEENREIPYIDVFNNPIPIYFFIPKS